MDTIEPIPTDRQTDPAIRALGPAIRRIRGALRHRAGDVDGPSSSLVRSILAEIAAHEPAAAVWSAKQLRAGDPAVIALAAGGPEPVAILRIARRASAGLERAKHAQTRARAAMRADGSVVPEVLGSGTTGASAWLLERALPGEPGRSRMDTAERRAAAVAAVTRALRPLHASAETRPVADPDRAAWIGDRLRLVGEVAGEGSATSSWAADTGTRLTDAVAGRTLPIGRIHGDLWLENARFEPGTNRVSAIVDWDSSAEGELALQDLVHLGITTRRRAERRDFGPVVVEALRAASANPDRPLTLAGLLGQAGVPADRDVLEAPIAPADLDPVSTLLLAWLRFVEVNVTRHPELAADRRWVDANVRPVIGWR